MLISTRTHRWECRCSRKAVLQRRAYKESEGERRHEPPREGEGALEVDEQPAVVAAMAALRSAYITEQVRRLCAEDPAAAKAGVA